MSKPVVAYVAGVTAPPGRKMGHAGAIVSGSQGTAQAKMDALRAAGVQVALNPTEAGELMAQVVGSQRPRQRTSVPRGAHRPPAHRRASGALVGRQRSQPVRATRYRLAYAVYR